MAIQKFSVSADPAHYEAWPDLVRLESGRLVCVFTECTHHLDRSYSRIMLTESDDRGRTWSPKHPLTEPAGTAKNFYFNCARISRLADGLLAVTVDRIRLDCGESNPDASQILLFFSTNGGKDWSGPVETPMTGIVPDKLTELPGGRLLLSAHHSVNGKLAEFLRYSDDAGRHWSNPVTVAQSPDLNLCEASILPLDEHTVVAFLRENSCRGWDCKKVLSCDGGETWGPIIDFPLPGCHRPTAGFLNDGSILITYRFHQGGLPGWGNCTQNFFAALTDRASVLASTRSEAKARILPVDFDRSPAADTGYSGWTQFDDDEIYIVNYIVDDAPKGQIRGYSLVPNDFLLTKGAFK